MKQPGRQASGQDGSRSPAFHSGNKHFRGRSEGSVSFVPFLYTAAQNALGISAEAKGLEDGR